MGRAYYNEIDPFAAQWLRELIKIGAIAPGDVDERDIRDVKPSDLEGYTQCHFFAGIGVWSYALRLAGWPDDKPVWTGSCPCQPFSAAGKRGGTSDERHLWPAFHWLISQCRPDVVLGEQVASRDGLAWLDIVSTDLEASGYACGPVNLPACGVGAPHIRQRLWFAAERVGLVANPLPAGRTERGSESGNGSVTRGGSTNGVGQADAHGKQRGLLLHPGQPGGKGAEAIRSRQVSGVGQADTHSESGERDAGGLPGEEAEVDREGRQDGRISDGSSISSAAGGVALGDTYDEGPQGRGLRLVGSADQQPSGAPGPVNGFWANAEWIPCRDGKARPIEPGTSPLAHGIAGRVGRLRGYGNAINARAAKAFIEAYLSSKKDAA